MNALAPIPLTDDDKRSAALNTKIECLTESIEALVLASVHGITHKLTGDAALAQFDAVMEARKAVADSIRLVLTPTLRVVS